MATVTESIGDAEADIYTVYSMAVGDTFVGRLEDALDEDWIKIELEEGLRYEIRLTGYGTEGSRLSLAPVFQIFKLHG